MATRIRGQETFVQVVVDGALLAGSFQKVDNFKFSSRADITNTGFLGETEDEPDIQHHGYDFSFTIHEMDNKAMEVWDNVVSTLQQGIAQPAVNIVYLKRYRDPSIKPVSITFQSAKLKLDSQEASSRKDFVKSMFSGSCKRKKTK